ncbi:unnamed protein product [Adineta steineri]|nr:unnamed protein product [Adineta steineri]
MVDEHVVEMQRQLTATNSIFAWVQAYIKYMTFFIRNFGSAAKVYGRAHIDGVIDALVRIHNKLFPNTKGNIVMALAASLEEKFGVTSIPVGWYFWPTAAGGLQILELAKTWERNDYENAKRLWEDGTTFNQVIQQQQYVAQISATDPFFSFEEFIKCREERSMRWVNAFDTLLTRPIPVHLNSTPETMAALSIISDGIEAFGSSVSETWQGLTFYWKWLISLHHEEMIKKYGSLLIVEPTSIPVGMVAVFRNSRTRWEQ